MVQACLCNPLSPKAIEHLQTFWYLDNFLHPCDHGMCIIYIKTEILFFKHNLRRTCTDVLRLCSTRKSWNKYIPYIAFGNHWQFWKDIVHDLYACKKYVEKLSNYDLISFQFFYKLGLKRLNAPKRSWRKFEYSFSLVCHMIPIAAYKK